MYLCIDTIIVYVKPILISRFYDRIPVFLLCLYFLLLEPGEKWRRNLSVREVLRHEEGLEDDKVHEDQSSNGEENLQHIVTSIEQLMINYFTDLEQACIETHSE